MDKGTEGISVSLQAEPGGVSTHLKIKIQVLNSRTGQRVRYKSFQTNNFCRFISRVKPSGAASRSVSKGMSMIGRL